MLALIIVICLTVIGNLGSNVANTFKNVDSKMDSAGVATATPLT
jgi:Flp pilus assembly pilin Flp